jgi:hypothetical protein
MSKSNCNLKSASITDSKEPIPPSTLMSSKHELIRVESDGTFFSKKKYVFTWSMQEIRWL